MSNGMYCSASHWIESSSSAGVMTGSVIFLTMTALPDNEAQTSFALNALFSAKTRRMASATAPASMMAPSTMASGGTGCMPKAATRYPRPDGRNSTALTALDPMSSPTRFFVRPNTGTSLAARAAHVARGGPYRLSCLFIGRSGNGNTAARRRAGAPHALGGGLETVAVDVP